MKGFVSFIVLLLTGILCCLPSYGQITPLKNKIKDSSTNTTKTLVATNNSPAKTNKTSAFCDALGMYNKDTTICLGTSFTLNAKDAYDYVWSPGDGLSSTTVQNPTLTADATRTYKLVSRKFSGTLVTNGDFSAGDLNVNSSYNSVSCTDGLCLIPEGLYGIGKEAHKLHNQFIGTKDHTTGAGNFMIVNGAGSPNTVVWSQTVTVKPGTDYNFSTWVSSLLPGSPAILQFQINGVTIGPPFNAPSAVNIWQQFFVHWNSGGNTTATITILNQNTVAYGNDFGLDDIFFEELTPCPAEIKVTVIKKPTIEIKASPTAICEGTPITFTATAKDEGPSAVYQWKLNGAVVGTNAPTFFSGTLKDGDEISSTVTNSCGTTESNKIKITVATKLSPAIAIKASATNICI
ncbi:MAG TPA: hypothetical protein VM888_06090, partial [Chitinophagaceae bacterium]|nr:hypothetical protein [Chitinophagaceae bacterium]